MTRLTSMTISPTKMHPDYGYPERKRIDAVAYSYVTSVKQSAEAHNVSPASIYKWRKVYNVTPLYYA